MTFSPFHDPEYVKRVQASSRVSLAELQANFERVHRAAFVSLAELQANFARVGVRRTRRLGALTFERGLHSVYLHHERFHVALERLVHGRKLEVRLPRGRRLTLPLPDGRRLEVRWQPEMYPLEGDVQFVRRLVVAWDWLPHFRRAPAYGEPAWTGRKHTIRVSWLFDWWRL
jgi:hypothetical protein